MKIARLASLVLSLLVASTVVAQQPSTKNSNPQKPPSSAAAKPWEKIAIPPLPPFHPQEPKRIELPNGMILFLQEDHELPLINGTIRVRGGSLLEPADKVGLIDIYSEAWRTGGTTSKTGDELDDFLEERAAKVETGGGLESTSVSWSCLKGDFNDVFNIVLDVLNNPAFREDKIALAQRQMYSAISRRNDEPGEIAGREAAFLAYGETSPYARIPQYYTVASVTRDDLVNWHKRFVYPNNIMLGIDGDFDGAAMEAKLRQAFADWPRGPEAPRNVESTPVEPAQPGVYFVQKSDVNQSNVRLVHLGITRNNPDYYAVTVMNEVLGGGFSGRLIQNLRTKAGLAYDVHGGIGAGFDHDGIFQLVMETKSNSTAAATVGLLTQLDDIKTKPATEAELKRAKDTILNSFIFDFDDKEKVLAERMTYEFYGYPPDFLERFRAGIEKVTAADVARVADKYVHPQQMAIFVLGNSADFDKQLSTFGNVKTIDISIPEAPPGKTAAAAPASK